VIINISMFMSVQGLPSLAKAREFKLELLFRVLEYEHTRATFKLRYETIYYSATADRLVLA
jgi:hypothetical protein